MRLDTPLFKGLAVITFLYLFIAYAPTWLLALIGVAAFGHHLGKWSKDWVWS